MPKKSIKEEIREILAEDFAGDGPSSLFQSAMSKARADWIKNPPGLDSEFVGPPLPEQGMAGPFAADYVNAPPGHEPAPTEPLDYYDLKYGGKGIAPYLEYGEMLTGTGMPYEDYRKRSNARMDVRDEAHPASGYYGEFATPRSAPAMGSRTFHPSYEQVPETREFYPPPTISNEEQEIIDGGKDDLAGAIMRALGESKKKDKK